MEKPAKAVNIRHRKHISTFPVWVVFLCMLPGILHYTIFRLFPSVMTAVLTTRLIQHVSSTSSAFQLRLKLFLTRKEKLTTN